MFKSREVETVKVHDFVPRCHKVVQELLLGVLASVDFRQGPELGARAEGGRLSQLPEGPLCRIGRGNAGGSGAIADPDRS